MKTFLFHKIPLEFRSRLFFPVLSLALMAGCVRDEYSENKIAPELTVTRITDQGVLHFDPMIRNRDGGSSCLWRGKSYWFFGDTVTDLPAASGFGWVSNSTAELSDWKDVAPNKLIFRELNAIPPKPPVEFFQWQQEEAQYNTQHFNSGVPEKQRSRYAIWPGPMVSTPDQPNALVFYTLLKCGSSGEWDFQSLGKSIAVWKDPEKPPERSGLLFPISGIQLGDAATVSGGWLYAYGTDCRRYSWPVRLGRVRFQDALQRDKWEFFAGNGRWTPDEKQAVPVMNAAPSFSVHWNRFLNRYLAVYVVPFRNQIAIRTAVSPEGPWSCPMIIAECSPSINPVGCYAGFAHSELGGGQVEYITYYRDTGLFQGEIRLLQMIPGTLPKR